MKKWYKLCPYCANEIKEWAIKCQFCNEFLDDNAEIKSTKTDSKNTNKKVELAEKWSIRRKWGLALVLIIPITGVLWFIFSLIFRFISTAWWSAYAYWDVYTWNPWWESMLMVINKVVNRLLWMIAMFWLIWFIPWLAMLIKKDKKYNPYIQLKTYRHELEPVYQEYFNTESLPKQDITNMKYHWFKGELHTAWVVIFNILTLGLFWTIYCWLHHTDLPHIKEDDFTATKGIWFLFIPFFNLYWICKFWLRLVNRINFQFKLRGRELPVSKWLAITFLVLQYIPYLNILGILIFWSIMVGQIESGVRKLAIENN